MDFNQMDLTSLILLITTLCGGAWGAIERYNNIKKQKADLVGSLMDAASKLVNDYQEQIVELKASIVELNARITVLEGKLGEVSRCPSPDCPMRKVIRLELQR